MALTVYRGGDAAPAVKGTDTFAGEAWRNPLFSKDGVSAGNNFFAPGARTHWHTHEGGQLLIVLSGSGFVVDDDGANPVASGDLIWTPPGVRHWHGGSSSGFLLHVSVSLGRTDWLEPVAEAEYEDAQRQRL